ncbi:hypothetical protein F2Q69_00016399 [Brassica cretica]|nr:hypothetical protein F2Q69_00016399 [Brassica cretica]
MAYASRFLSRSKQLQGSLVILQQHHAIPVRAFAKEAARPTFKGDEMLKGVFTEIKNKFLAAVDILRKEKITLDPEDPAAVKQYANVMKTIRQKADMFSESQRIKYDIENETKEIPDARAYLLKLKDIRTR